MARNAAAMAAATAVLSEASASALKDVIAQDGISQEEQAESIVAAREQRMQQLLYAITVLASSSGAAHGKLGRGVCFEHWFGCCFGVDQGMWKKASVKREGPTAVGQSLSMLCCAALRCPCAGVATERAQFMDLVRQQVSQLQDTHGTDSPTLTFTGGSLRAVRPEELSDMVSAHESLSQCGVF